MDELVLGYQDYLNYNALCAVNDGVPFKKGHRRLQRDTLSSGQRCLKLIAQDCKCSCGGKFEFNGKDFVDVTTEHVIPFRYGGQANLHNTTIMHHKCNRKREEEDVWISIENVFGPVDRTALVPHTTPMTIQQFKVI